MKKLDFGQTVSLFANLGVIAGIIFLGVEIRQNQSAFEEQNMLTRLSAREVAGETYGRFRYMLMENPDLLQVWHKVQAEEPLSKLEQQQFYQMCVERVYMQLSVYNRFVALGETREAEGLARVLGQGVETSRTVGCWENSKQEILSRGYETFVKVVESAREQP